MDSVFSELLSLSANAKWLLISLQTTEVPERMRNQTELSKIGCPKNKINKVIDELVNFNVLEIYSEAHKRAGRPKLFYAFNKEKLSHLFESSLTNIERVTASEFSIPVKLVWLFLCSNQDELGYVENFSIPAIAKACGLENAGVKTAISKLVASKIIQQLTTGCTFKNNELFTSEKRQFNQKRPSAYMLSPVNQNSTLKLLPTALKLHFSSFLSSKMITKEEYVSSIISSLPTNLNKHYKVFFYKYLNSIFSEYPFKLVKSYLASQPEGAIANFRSSLALLTVKCIKKILFYRNPKNQLSTLDVSNSLFGTTKEFQVDSNLYHLNRFITSFINFYVHCFLFSAYTYFEEPDPLRLNSYKDFVSDIGDIKTDVFVLDKSLYLCLSTSEPTAKTKLAFISKIWKLEFED